MLSDNRTCLNSNYLNHRGIDITHPLGWKKVFSMKPKLSGGLVHDMPADLAEALTEIGLIDTWEALSAIGRNEFICWVEDAKQEKTRVKRIVRATEELLEGKKRPCCWVGCIHRTDKKPSKWQQDVLIDKKPKPQ